MTYATDQDIEQSYGADRLDMLASVDGVRDTTKIARALADASALIDGYICNKYALPLAGPAGGGQSEGPAVLREACVSIAVYKLTDPATLTEDARKRFDDSIGFLKDIARGLVGLGLPTRGDAAAGAASQAMASPQTVLVDADQRMFTRQSLRRM